MRICILGGGGNVAEAVSSALKVKGHQVSQFRFDVQIPVQGTPPRPPRSAARLVESQIKRVFESAQDLPDYKNDWISVAQFKDMDAFIFAFPSYMAEPCARLLGQHMAHRPLLTLSDRFLGSYAFLTEVLHHHGEQFMPSFAVAFNGVPIMAQKETRDSAVSVFYIKSKHSFACYPQAATQDAKGLLSDMLGLGNDQLNRYDSMLHLAFENTHCIEHAVVDLANLRSGKYRAGGKLYSKELYKPEVLNRIDAVAADRDRISRTVLGKNFASLKEYDLRVFNQGGSPGSSIAGQADFRIYHDSLSKAPNPERWGAFGYEDNGWSMVTLESFGKLFNVPTPALSSLIDDWNAYTKCDYRIVGRTASSLRLYNQAFDMKKPEGYRQLSWLNGTFANPQQPLGALNNTEQQMIRAIN